MRNLTTILPNPNADKWLNFQESQLKQIIVKHFTRPKQPAALSKLFSLFRTHP